MTEGRTVILTEGSLKIHLIVSLRIKLKGLKDGVNRK